MNGTAGRRGSRFLRTKSHGGSSAKRIRAAGFLAAVLLVTGQSDGRCQSPCPGIHVTIRNLKNSSGNVDCSLFDTPAGFPRDYLRAAEGRVTRIRGGQARCDFAVPAGTYAVAVIHDEDSNGKLNTNWLGVPTEGYGFSNDARGTLGPPSFSAASFEYDGGSLDLKINVHY